MTHTKEEALKLALEALEGVLDDSHKVLEASISGGLYEVVQCRDAITAIKQALAAPVPCCGKYETCTQACTPRGKFLGAREAAAQRQWVGLTDEQIKAIDEMALTKNMAIAMTMATVKEKNT
jgi:hypothetical protein